MKKSYKCGVLSALIIFFSYNMSKATVFLNDTTDNRMVITEIVEEYKVDDSLANHAKGLTRSLISSWDSIQTVNHTLILDTLNTGNYSTNMYRAIISLEDGMYQDEARKDYLLYRVVLENLKNGKRLDEIRNESVPDLFFSYRESTVKILLKNISVTNNLTETEHLLTNPNPIKNNNTLTFGIRSVNFDNVSFTDSQKLYFTNLINNVLVSRENGYRRYNTKDKVAGNQIDFLTVLDQPASINMADLDFILDFDFTEDKENNTISLGFEVSGKTEANLLVPSRFNPSVNFDRDLFLEGETIESNIKINRKLFEFIQFQFFL